MSGAQRRMPFCVTPEGERPQNWGTPIDLFREIERRYAYGGKFDLDAAAETWSAKARWFFSDSPAVAPGALGPVDPFDPGCPTDLGDAFDRVTWSLAPYGGPLRPRVYFNPPFDSIGDWLKRARIELERGTIAQALALVPSRMGRDWWTEHVPRAAFVRPVRGRIDFDPPPGAKASGGFEDCVVLGFEPELPAKPGRNP